MVPEMAELRWARVDLNTLRHDKFLALKADPSRHNWQAIASWTAALLWSVESKTDGFVPTYALDSVWGTAATAALLVKYRLWEKVDGGYLIHDFDHFQQLNGITKDLTSSRITGGRRGACSRWHGPDCWQEDYGCSHMANQ